MRRRWSIAGAGVTIGLVVLVGAGCGGVVSFETEAGPEPIVSGVYATTTVVVDDSCSPPIEVESPARAAVVAAAANGAPRWVRFPALDFLTMEAPWEGDAYAAIFEGEVLSCPPGAWMWVSVEVSPLRDGRFTADLELVYTGLAGCDAATPPWPLPSDDCQVRFTTTYELVEACEAPCTLVEDPPTCDCP